MRVLQTLAYVPCKGIPLGNKKDARSVTFDHQSLEASTGFEPVVRVLQTLALPLGHDAISSTERAMGFEPTTFSLARRRTTTVLRPRSWSIFLTESAETQDRTGDTAIFSRVLYQLSYLGQMYFIVKRP